MNVLYPRDVSWAPLEMVLGVWCEYIGIFILALGCEYM